MSEQSFDLKQWITTREAANLTGYSQTYVSRLLRDGRVKGEKLGHDWLVNRESIMTFYRKMQDLGAEKYSPHR